MGYFLKAHPDLTAVIIPNSRSQGSPERYSFPMAMATRPNDPRLHAEVERVIATHQAQLEAVLREYNIRFFAPGEARDGSKIGIVGTGRMGANIARRLHDVGYPVVALYDADPESARETAKESGGEVTRSLARVADLADVILTVVSDDAAMHSVFAPSGDSLLSAASGKVFVNCATITPKVHVEVQRLVEERGGRLARGVHGELDSASAQRHALPDGRRAS